MTLSTIVVNHLVDGMVIKGIGSGDLLSISHTQQNASIDVFSFLRTDRSDTI